VNVVFLPQWGGRPFASVACFYTDAVLVDAPFLIACGEMNTKSSVSRGAHLRDGPFFGEDPY
jgi:hypothetical protein